jgi:TfoX/Sxy family transcriptional regulator of competence genes
MPVSLLFIKDILFGIENNVEIYYITPMRYCLLLSSVFLLLACAGYAPQIQYENSDEEILYEVLYDDPPDYSPAPRARMLKAAALSGGGDQRMMLQSDMDYSLAIEQASTSRQERMVNYTGNITMQSSEPESLIDTVAERAKAKGGSVGNRRNGYISLQIPVAEFKNFFNQILTLGRVSSKNISASDITEAYSDNAARLRIAESTLARLQQLLAAAKTEQEKIALLKEIQRVSEQIEQRKLEEKELLRQAAFSTINLWVSNIPVAVPYRANISAFEWFPSLLSINSYYPSYSKALKLSVPRDFIETENSTNEWSAASALNSKFWSIERKNKPQGTANFWAEAMLEFFKSQYATELKAEENFFLIRLQGFGTEPKVHYIALLKKSDKKKLRIALAYFPNIEAEKKNSEAVLEVLRRVK